MSTLCTFEKAFELRLQMLATKERVVDQEGLAQANSLEELAQQYQWLQNHVNGEVVGARIVNFLRSIDNFRQLETWYNDGRTFVHAVRELIADRMIQLIKAIDFDTEPPVWFIEALRSYNSAHPLAVYLHAKALELIEAQQSASA